MSNTDRAAEILQQLIDTAPDNPYDPSWSARMLDNQDGWLRAGPTGTWHDLIEAIAHEVNNSMGIKRKIIVGLRVNISIEVDPVAWAAEYGIELTDVRQDVHDYVFHGLPMAFTNEALVVSAEERL